MTVQMNENSMRFQTISPHYIVLITESMQCMNPVKCVTFVVICNQRKPKLAAAESESNLHAFICIVKQ